LIKEEMTTQTEKLVESYKTIMEDSKLQKLIALLPENLKLTTMHLSKSVYGAYLCQAENEPDTYSDMHDLYTMHDVYKMLRDFENNLYKEEALDREVIDGLDTYIYAHSWERCQALTTVENVSSLFTYYIMLLLMRQIGKQAYDALSEDETGTPPVDWTPNDSPFQSLYWESLHFREQKALQYVGLDIHHYSDPAVQTELVSKETVQERLDVLFNTPKYKSYKTFVFDKSLTKALDSVGWLKSKAKRLIKYTVDQGASPSSVAALKICVDLYTASMRTSTTGAMLGSSRSVFSPKPIEGTRLLRNLFEHHIQHCVQVCTKDMIDLMDAAVKNVDKFEELEYNRERPDYRPSTRQRNSGPASVRRV